MTQEIDLKKNILTIRWTQPNPFKGLLGGTYAIGH